ncbi:MAG: hypothetical protein ACT4O1_16580 [Gemmatimonadota bacterium]
MLMIVAGCERNQTENAVPADSAEVAAAPRPAIPLPPKLLSQADTNAVIQAVSAAQMTNQEFNGHFGDRQPIGNNTEGLIEPHIRSQVGNIVSGKVLARIGVDRDVSEYGWSRSGWNYWIAAQLTNIPGWSALMVNVTTRSVKALPMELQPGQSHKDPGAKFEAPRRLAMAVETGSWVTCDGATCCCTGPNCEDRKVPPDSSPPAMPDTVP